MNGQLLAGITQGPVNRRRSTSLFLAWMLSGAGVVALLWLFGTAVAAPAGSHCIGVGPDDILNDDLNVPAFCGCTWGAILYRGQPVTGAGVTLEFGGARKTVYTNDYGVEDFPFYSLSGKDLGAQRGDIMTLTVTFAGETLTRSFRAWPESAGEQRLDLAFPERGVWTRISQAGGFTQTVVAGIGTLWAGGKNGILRISADGISQQFPPPAEGADIRHIAVEEDDGLWALWPNGLARFADNIWVDATPPYSGTWRSLALGSQAGTVWVGGNEANTGVIAYLHDQQWSRLWGPSPGPIVALAADRHNGLWASMWGHGVAYWNGTTWTLYRSSTGFFSDFVYTIWIQQAGTGDTVWFGGQPILGSDAGSAIARFAPSTSTWREYGVADGLHSDPLATESAAPVFSLTQDTFGNPWAASEAGLALYGGHDKWTTVALPASPPVRDVAIEGEHYAALLSDGLYTRDNNMAPGSPPVTQINALSGTADARSWVELTASASDADENRIVAWQWTTSTETPLCSTEARCTFPAAWLGAGTHDIILKVQDDEGNWSLPASATVHIVNRLHLPFIRGGE